MEPGNGAVWAGLAESALASGDKQQALMEASQKMAEVAQAKAQADASQAGEPQDGAANADDDVVDAEFEEVKDDKK